MTLASRVIACLDVTEGRVVKGVNFTDLVDAGDPVEMAKVYNLEGVDELTFLDISASNMNRATTLDVVARTAEQVFIPLTVGGGIRKIEDVTEILRSGADKVAINTAAVSNPEIISDVAHRFGSQCMVSSIEAKQVGVGKWEVYTNNGREKTGLDVIEWAKKCEQKGAGEILLTSVDREGTRKGFDIELIKAVTSAISLPVIASGGMGKLDDALLASIDGGADAVAAADILHYGRAKVSEIRDVAKKAGLRVRNYDIV